LPERFAECVVGLRIEADFAATDAMILVLVQEIRLVMLLQTLYLRIKHRLLIQIPHQATLKIKHHSFSQRLRHQMYLP
jgi:hypothetical protein